MVMYLVITPKRRYHPTRQQWRHNRRHEQTPLLDGLTVNIHSQTRLLAIIVPGVTG
jgi:hypothetical protein